MTTSFFFLEYAGELHIISLKRSDDLKDNAEKVKLTFPCQGHLNINTKKTQPAGGKTAPLWFRVKKKGPTQTEKTPEPLSPSYTGASAAHVRAGSVPRTVTTTGPGLSLCFENEERRGVFLTQGEICSHWDSNSGPGRCQLELSPLRCESLGRTKILKSSFQ
jgi:hypothetical protein